jgi:CelD/BcsL family acetyltransferase involved in cellulose biosynthesis
VLLERATELHVTIARTTSDLETLAPHWHELWLHDARATPFQSPAWLIPWAKHFTAGEFCCATTWRDDELVALIPAFIWRNPETQLRELLLLGTGISDYVDCLSASDDAAEAALDALREDEDWDVLNFEQLPFTSVLASDAESLEEQSVSPVLQLPESTDALENAVPRAQLQNVAYYRRRAERIAEVRFEAANSHSLEVMLDDLFRLHSARWNQSSRAGALSHETLRAFHREAARELLSIGALRFYQLTIRRQTAAVLYAFSSHARTYYYLSGFDPKFASVSPGTLIIHHAIEQAVREQCTHFDFLRGTERYKYLWGAKETRTFRRVERRESRIES